MTSPQPIDRIGLPAKPAGLGHNGPGMRCHHWAVYGLTCADYEAMRAYYGSRCGICRTPEAETRRGMLVIDHFHSSRSASFVRGLLCDWCNQSVMPCFDGSKVWGPQNRQWEAAARKYERNCWGTPSEVALAEMAARTEKLSKFDPRYVPPVRIREPLEPPPPAVRSIEIPLNRGPAAIARKLRRHLSPAQVERLTQLLSQEA